MILTFDDVNRGDIICLNQYPYKPVKVYMKKKDELYLRVETPVSSTLQMTEEKFNKAGYIKSNSKVF